MKYDYRGPPVGGYLIILGSFIFFNIIVLYELHSEILKGGNAIVYLAILFILWFGAINCLIGNIRGHK